MKQNTNTDENITGGLFNRLKRNRTNKVLKEEELKDELKEKSDNKENKHNEVIEQPRITLRESIDKLNEHIDNLTAKKKYEDKAKKKILKMPSSIKRNMKKLTMKNKILVFYLQTNRGAKPLIAEIKDGLININGKWHDCSMYYTFLWMGKYPAVFLPEWSLTPIGTKDYYDAIQQGKVGVDPQSIIIRALEAANNPLATNLKKGSIIWIIIGGIVLAYILFGQG